MVHRATHLTNVRDLPSTFVGRLADCAGIANAFDEGARLVTLTGSGGVGKTRVALRLGLTLCESYSAPGGGGVWMCDLTEVHDLRAICATIANVLGFSLTSGTERENCEEVARVLGARGRILLILDNFEQLVDHAATTVHRWLESAPHLRILVTSRVPLGLAGETRWLLPGLELPAIDAPPDAITHAAAVELFVRRAREVRGDRTFDAEELLAVADIVRRIDGVPLAIELAAARTNALSLKDLRDRLDRSLALLVKRGKSGDRHASMRQVILDSHDMLPATPRVIFAKCAVFQASFSLDAAEEILGPDGDVLTSLETLVEHSLLRSSVDDQGVRFSLYQTIREVAEEKLDGLGARSAIAERHATFFAAFAQQADDTAVMADLENCLAAHHNAVERKDRVASERLALSLSRVLRTRGLLQLRFRLLEEAMQCGSTKSASNSANAALQIERGYARGELGDTEGALRDFNEGLASAVATEDFLLQALAETRIAEFIEARGATGEARVSLGRALTAIEKAEKSRAARACEASIHARVGHTFRREGDLDRAEIATHQAIVLLREVGAKETLAMALYEAAAIAFFRSRYDAARAYIDEGLLLAQASGARLAEASLTSELGELLQEQGRLSEAIDTHARAVELFRDVGNLYREGSTLYYLATAYAEQGSPREAFALLARALEQLRSFGSPRYVALIESCRAALLADEGNDAAAHAALAAADKAAEGCESEKAVLATLAIHRLHVQFSSLEPTARLSALEQARALCAQNPSDDPRFALRSLEARARGVNPGRPDTLVVRAEGRGFRLPGGANDIDLSTRAPLCRILAALAHQRKIAPGKPLSLDDVLTAGWPDERVDHASATNRVYVALATLRKLGLKDHIRTVRHGYILDPATPVDF